MSEPKNKHDMETINTNLVNIISALQDESMIIYDVDGGDFTSEVSQYVIDGGTF